MRPILKKLTLTLKILPLILIGTVLSVFLGSNLLLSQFEEISSKQIMQSRDLLNNEKNVSKDIQAKALESKAHTLGTFMSSVAVDLILSSDFESLLMYRDNALKDPDIAYATFLNTNLKPLIEYNKTDTQVAIIEKKFEIESEGESLGYVLLGVSLKRVNTAFEQSDDRIHQAMDAVKENSNEAYNNFFFILSMMVFGIIISVIVTVYITFKKLIVTKLQNTTQLMNKLSQGSGDLTKRLPTDNQDEISMLCVSVNEFIVTLQEMVLSISTNIDQLTQESNLLEEEGQSLSLHASSQAEEASLTASSMTEMTASVKSVVLSSENAEEMAKNANVEAEKGASVIVETIKSINLLSQEIVQSSKVVFSLQEESKNIGGVLDVIRGIAEQTNLLALNAAIEAARAGDQGRGFAVVADEVRTLASRTQSATEEINKMIESLQSGSEDAVAAMSISTKSAESAVKQSQLADTSLKNIVEAMSTISDMNFQIKESAEEQRQVAESVDQSILKINDTSHKTAETAEKTALISKNLSSLARGLKEMVGKFEA